MCNFDEFQGGHKRCPWPKLSSSCPRVCTIILYFSRILTFMWVRTTQSTAEVHSHNRVEVVASKETTFPYLTNFSPIGMSVEKSMVTQPKFLYTNGPSIVMAFLMSLAMRMTNCFPISTKSMAMLCLQGHQIYKLKVKFYSYPPKFG